MQYKELLIAADVKTQQEYVQFINDIDIDSEENVTKCMKMLKSWFIEDEHWFARDLIDRM